MGPLQTSKVSKCTPGVFPQKTGTSLLDRINSTCEQVLAPYSLGKAMDISILTNLYSPGHVVAHNPRVDDKPIRIVWVGAYQAVEIHYKTTHSDRPTRPPAPLDPSY